jgi:hypothetical protein
MLSAFIIFPILYAQDDGMNVSTGNYEGSSRLGINDSFSLSGSIISTVISTDSNVENKSSAALDSLEHNSHLDSELFGNSVPLNHSSFKDQIAGHKSDDKLVSEPELKNSRPSEKMNQTDSFSNNLVSMLSGIIIQSIEKGNPTITNTSMNNNNSTNLNNTLMIVSGNWRMNVHNSQVTVFDARLVMINADGTGFHWHLVDNFHSSSHSFFGIDGNMFLNGSVDFYTDNKEIAKKINISILINNLEALQIILNDKNISSHFYGYPIYGTIDKVEIPN